MIYRAKELPDSSDTTPKAWRIERKRWYGWEYVHTVYGTAEAAQTFLKKLVTPHVIVARSTK